MGKEAIRRLGMDYAGPDIDLQYFLTNTHIYMYLSVPRISDHMIVECYPESNAKSS